MNSDQKKLYVVVGNRPWNKSLYNEKLQCLPGQWEFASNPTELQGLIKSIRTPRYIFFLHWSHRVSAEIFERFECVCFHMTDVPYGRGGSPLQNLIQRGHRETQLTALRMVHEMDAGPIYCKRKLSLEGSAEEIYIRAGYLSAEIITEMISDEPSCTSQVGVPVIFHRRTPAQSLIPAALKNLTELHDFIRMLDAEGYPHAFIDYGQFRLEFTRSSQSDDSLIAQVRISEVDSSLKKK